MTLNYRILIVATMLLAVSAPWTSPAFAEPAPPKIDWKQFLDLQGDEDPEYAVGEQMC